MNSKCEHCGDSSGMAILPNGVPFCRDCDLPGSMVQTAYTKSSGWYLDQLDGATEADAEANARRWLWQLQAEQAEGNAD